MRSVSIFGATGSIGESTYDLMLHAGGAQAFRTVALTGGRNVVRLAQMARELRAELAVTAYDDCLPALREALAGTGIAVAAGAAAIAEAADRP
ncbi:MAG: 1-deoxy-D-xylulose-5-phosphate reductoisomerase, partial [Paracoccaceae bacterium]|nr:1-deoxy-D-xylulose-5-phosphate reductoisomerase [Paracoccaceae bacterium]